MTRCLDVNRIAECIQDASLKLDGVAVKLSTAQLTLADVDEAIECFKETVSDILEQAMYLGGAREELRAETWRVNITRETEDLSTEGDTK